MNRLKKRRGKTGTTVPDAQNEVRRLSALLKHTMREMTRLTRRLPDESHLDVLREGILNDDDLVVEYHFSVVCKEGHVANIEGYQTIARGLAISRMPQLPEMIEKIINNQVADAVGADVIKFTQQHQRPGDAYAAVPSPAQLGHELPSIPTIPPPGGAGGLSSA